MTTAARIHRAKAAIEEWFTAPEPTAAGNVGLFRIVYCLFYLWHLSGIIGANFAGLPYWGRIRILLVHLIPIDFVTPTYLSVLESCVAAAVVVLLCGYQTRAATAAVLVLGSLFEAHLMTYRTERGGVMLAFYIPFFMFLANTWGRTHSLDALIARRQHGTTVDVHDSSGAFYYPARAALVVLVALFVSAACAKLGAGTTWLPMRDMLGDQLLLNNLHGAVLGATTTPVPALVARTPLLEVGLRYVVILVEASMVLALINRTWRNVMVPFILFFHAMNALVLFVTFTPILAVYGLFADWQWIRDRLLPARITWFDNVPTPVLVVSTFTLATGVGLAWNSGTLVRDALQLWGLLDWRTIWIPVIPLALIWLTVSVRRLFGSFRHRAIAAAPFPGTAGRTQQKI